MREKENAQEEKNPQVINGTLGGVIFAIVVLVKYKAQLEVLCHFQPKFKWFGDLQIHESKKEKKRRI